jgi:hypothetical protein
MWGGLRRPEPLAAIKHDQKKLSLGFGPWREKAGRRLRAAAIKGELVIYLLAKPQARSEDHSLTECSLEKIEPVVVPVNVVKRLIISRGGLPDHPIRPSIKTTEGNETLFALLTVGLLVVRASDFDGWYQSERAKGRWPSQRSKSKSNGRPTKQTDPLRNAVLALIHDHKWSGKDSIGALHRVLVASGHSEVPSQDTACSSGRPFAQRNRRSRAFADHPRTAQADLVNVRFGTHSGLKSMSEMCQYATSYACDPKLIELSGNSEACFSPNKKPGAL